MTDKQITAFQRSYTQDVIPLLKTQIVETKEYLHVCTYYYNRRDVYNSRFKALRSRSTYKQYIYENQIFYNDIKK